MVHRLDGARLKVGRAREHMQALDVQCRAAVDDHPHSLFVETDPKTGEHIVKFKTDGANYPDQIKLIVGDVIHNLRSALDHVAWQLADFDSGRPPGRWVQWPIFHKESDYLRHEDKYLEGINAGHRTTIRALQPYHVMEPGLSLDIRARLVLLLTIGRLDDMDKHRLLVPTRAAAPASVQADRVFVAKPYKAELKFPADWVRMEDGAEYFRIVSMTETEGQMQVEAQPIFTVLFGDPDLIFGEGHRAAAAVLEDRQKAFLTMVDLGLAADFIDAIIRGFGPDFP